MALVGEEGQPIPKPKPPDCLEPSPQQSQLDTDSSDDEMTDISDADITVTFEERKHVYIMMDDASWIPPPDSDDSDSEDDSGKKKSQNFGCLSSKPKSCNSSVETAQPHNEEGMIWQCSPERAGALRI